MDIGLPTFMGRCPYREQPPLSGLPLVHVQVTTIPGFGRKPAEKLALCGHSTLRALAPSYRETPNRSQWRPRRSLRGYTGEGATSFFVRGGGIHKPTRRGRLSTLSGHSPVY